MHPVVHAWGNERHKSCKQRAFEITDCALTRAFVELTGTGASLHSSIGGLEHPRPFWISA
jgi:hypothetical protein